MVTRIKFYQPNSTYPMLEENQKYFSLSTVSHDDSGMYVFAHDPVKAVGFGWKLWKYNFSSNCWTKLKQADYMRPIAVPKMVHSASASLLFTVRDLPEIIRYDVTTGRWIKNFIAPPLGEAVIYPTVCCEDEGTIFITLFTESSYILELYSVHVKTKKWNFLVQLPIPDFFTVSSTIKYENKLFFFLYNKISCFDITNNQLLPIQTASNVLSEIPKTYAESFIIMYKDSVYLTGKKIPPEDSRKIYKLHLPSLTWSVLPFELPDTLIQCKPVITKDGQMYVYCKDRMCQINLDEQPRLLQSMCWDAIIYHPRNLALTSYTDDELHDQRIPKKFRLKLRW